MRLAVIAILLFSQTVHAKRKLIVSYFQPFATFSSNHTSEVAKLLKINLEAHDDLEIILCPLNSKDSKGMPVAFHSPRKDITLEEERGSLKGVSSFEVLKECYEKHPDASQIISLGEGPCKIHIEGLGKNVMSTGGNKTLVDSNHNIIPLMEKIIKDGPAALSTDDVNIIASCMNLGKSSAESVVKYSGDAGVYVCNNLIYNFQNYLTQNKIPVSYSFVHVPQDLHTTAGIGCDTKAFQELLSDPKEKLDAAKFSELITNEVASFIRAKELVLTQMKPKIELSQKLTQLCTEPLLPGSTGDEFTSIAAKLEERSYGQLLNDPSLKECIQTKRNIQFKESKI